MAYMQQIGVGEYDQLSQGWAWMFNPPPYNFLDPPGTVIPDPFVAPAASMGFSGLGCGGAGCTCGGVCGRAGHVHGMGLFDAGLDLSQWGVGEWLVVAGGLYVVSQVFRQTRSDVRSVGKARKRRAAAKRKRIMQELGY